VELLNKINHSKLVPKTPFPWKASVWDRKLADILESYQVPKPPFVDNRYVYSVDRDDIPKWISAFSDVYGNLEILLGPKLSPPNLIETIPLIVKRLNQINEFLRSKFLECLLEDDEVPASLIYPLVDLRSMQPECSPCLSDWPSI